MNWVKTLFHRCGHRSIKNSRSFIVTDFLLRWFPGNGQSSSLQCVCVCVCVHLCACLCMYTPQHTHRNLRITYKSWSSLSFMEHNWLAYLLLAELPHWLKIHMRIHWEYRCEINTALLFWRKHWSRTIVTLCVCIFSLIVVLWALCTISSLISMSYHALQIKMSWLCLCTSDYHQWLSMV